MLKCITEADFRSGKYALIRLGNQENRRAIIRGLLASDTQKDFTHAKRLLIDMNIPLDVQICELFVLCGGKAAILNLLAHNDGCFMEQDGKKILEYWRHLCDEKTNDEFYEFARRHQPELFKFTPLSD